MFLFPAIHFCEESKKVTSPADYTRISETLQRLLLEKIVLLSLPEGAEWDAVVAQSNSQSVPHCGSAKRKPLPTIGMVMQTATQGRPTGRELYADVNSSTMQTPLYHSLHFGFWVLRSRIFCYNWRIIQLDCDYVLQRVCTQRAHTSPLSTDFVLG